jgi:cytochrome P450
MASFVRDGLLLDMERERHARVRRVMGRAFALRRIDERRDLMGAIAEELFDSFAGQGVSSGECDFLADFSHKYSIAVLCTLLGVDKEDIPIFSAATTELRLMSSFPLAPALPRIDAALTTLWNYSQDLVERRSCHPRGDFVSGLVEAQRVEGVLSEPELLWGIANLLFAGHDTTRGQLANAMRALAENPRAWQELRAAPETALRMLHESIRYYPIVQGLRRVPQEDLTIDGASIPAGSTVVLNTLAISRDPKRFAAPGVFDPARAIDSYAIAFGLGVHHCIGHMLAKAEMTEALTFLSRRIASFEIAGPYQRAPASGMLGGVDSLPIRFVLA